MILLPAIDLYDGKVVRRYKGDYRQMTVYSDHDGIITNQENLNPPDERLVEVRFDKKIGDHVNAFRTGIHRLGHIIVKEQTKEAAEQFMKEALDKIKITVTPE